MVVVTHCDLVRMRDEGEQIEAAVESVIFEFEGLKGMMVGQEEGGVGRGRRRVWMVGKESSMEELVGEMRRVGESIVRASENTVPSSFKRVLEACEEIASEMK
jgi:hypothetical protein